MKLRIYAISIAITALLTIDSSKADVTLTRGGRMRCAVVICESLFEGWSGLHPAYFECSLSDREERRKWGGREVSWAKLAEWELVEHLGLMGEGEITVRRAGAGEFASAMAEERARGLSIIALAGPASDPENAGGLQEKDACAESFLFDAGNSVVRVTALSPKGVYNGVIHLLEEAGFRWYMPGELGRVLPEGDALTLTAGRVIESPSFFRRGMGRFPEWARRMRNSTPGSTASAPHGIRPLSSSGARRRWFEEDESHEAQFALRAGKRVPGQLCLSNPELQKLVIDYWREQLREDPDAYRTGQGRLVIGMGPGDGSGFCECDECRALDGNVNTTYTNRRSVTDRYFWFYAQILDALEDEFPDLHLATMLYSDQMDPPVRIKPHPRIIGGIIAIHTCRIHGMTNPVCPESQYRDWLVRRWQELLGVDNVRYANYRFHLACPGLPFMMMHREREEIPRAYELGVRSVAGPLGVNWASEGPSHYVLARLMWDHETDVDAVLSEFFSRFYGPAAGPMERYTMTLDRALHDADYHGGTGLDLVHIYDEAVRKTARSALEQAERRVGLRPGWTGRRLVGADRVTGDNALYALRVEIASKNWSYFEAFADMIESRNAHDYVGAMAASDRCEEFLRQLREDYEFQLIRGLQARFFTSMARYKRRTVSGCERVTNGNEFIVGMSPEWDFLIEPQGVGERMGLHKPANTGGNWGRICTEKTWSYYGLRYYWGEAWYRQSVVIPREYEGRPVNIWLSGLISSGAKVFINGETAGISPGAEFDDFDLVSHSGSGLPFEFEVSELIRFGEPNTVVVRVVRDAMHEIGKGGLAGPVMFYVPAETEE